MMTMYFIVGLIGGLVGALAMLWLMVDRPQRDDGVLTLNTPMPAYEGSRTVMCGGCGKAVNTYDGFNPEEHDCDGELSPTQKRVAERENNR